MSERIITIISATVLFGITILFVTEIGQSRVDQIFPKTASHYVYKRSALTVVVMAISGVMGAMKLPAALGFSDPTVALPFSTMQAVLFIFLLFIFAVPMIVAYKAQPQGFTNGQVREVSIEDVLGEDEQENDEEGDWEEEVEPPMATPRKAPGDVNEIHFRRGTAT